MSHEEQFGTRYGSMNQVLVVVTCVSFDAVQVVTWTSCQMSHLNSFSFDN